MKKPDMDDYIRQLQRTHGLTQQELCRMLGYSSLTSLTRLMHGTVSRRSRQQFADRLRTCTGITLTRTESNALDDLIELYDIGDEFAIMVALRRFLRGEPPETIPVQVRDEQGITCSFLAHFVTRRIRRMLLLNSEHMGIFNDLAYLMLDGDFILEHQIFGSQNSLHTVQVLRGTMPILYSPRYVSHVYPVAFEEPPFARGLIVSDLLLCEYETPEGGTCCEIIFFPEPGRGEVLKTSESYENFMRFLPPADIKQPLLRHISSSDRQQFLSLRADMEQDVMVCRIRPDPAYVQIPVSILHAAMRDDIPPDMQHAAGEILHLFEQRHRYLRDSSTQQYSIFRRNSMQQFIRTGVLSDHIWCFRPFTMQERIEILRFIRYTLMERDNIHYVFLRDDDALQCDEIIFYEGRGLSIIRSSANTGEQEHSEVFVTQPQLLTIFKRFILESTLRYRVDTEQNAAAFMEELIEECKRGLHEEMQLQRKLTSD